MRNTITAIAMILILTIPALCLGSIGPAHRLEFPTVETAGWDAYRLRLEREWQADAVRDVTLELIPGSGYGINSVRSLNGTSSGLPCENKPAPRDMVSMMSFVWAEMFGGVDIVAEVKDFARQIRRKGRSVKVSRFVKVSRSERRDSRSKWKFIVACRIDDQTEVAALFKNRGGLFGGGSMALEINTLDPMSQDVGLTMAYSDGDFDIRADRMTLTETAEARLVVKF
jgi:hypothetical protein